MKTYENILSLISKFWKKLRRTNSSEELFSLLSKVSKLYNNFKPLDENPEYPELIGRQLQELIDKIKIKLRLMLRVEGFELAENIINKSKAQAERMMNDELVKFDIQLRVNPGIEKSLLVETLAQFSQSEADSNQWKVDDEDSLFREIRRSLKKYRESSDFSMIIEYRRNFSEELVTVLSKLFLSKLMCNYLDKLLNPPLVGVKIVQNDEQRQLLKKRWSNLLSDFNPIVDIVGLHQSNKDKNVKIWHQALLYCMISRINKTHHKKDQIKNTISSQYGCTNGGSFYTEVTKILNYNSRFKDYLKDHHNKPEQLRRYKSIIRGLPKYTKRVEVLLSTLPDIVIND